ncbi:MAG: hypothetical protein HYR72_18905 [Deltaproteobacteria bacterium]|nr:hypothetical protein [Deltaproteobacteria bacterium]MBI3386210.1 hypothetical protein [Deltaproteobacteria bacterium]
MTLLTTALLTMSAAAQTTFEKDGNIFFTDATGQTKQLTSSGKDAAPTLSPDKKYVTFIRTLDGPKIWTGRDDAYPQEIWIISSDGRGARRLVASPTKPGQESSLASFSNPQFAFDGRSVFFMTNCAAVSNCIYNVDVTTGRVKPLGGGNMLDVIHEGNCRGCLIVIKHKYFLAGGSYDWYWLLTSNGMEIDPIVDYSENAETELQRFKAETCQFRAPRDCRPHAVRSRHK